jgi:hypothetical protein
VSAKAPKGVAVSISLSSANHPRLGLAPQHSVQACQAFEISKPWLGAEEVYEALFVGAKRRAQEIGFDLSCDLETRDQKADSRSMLVARWSLYALRPEPGALPEQAALDCLKAAWEASASARGDLGFNLGGSFTEPSNDVVISDERSLVICRQSLARALADREALSLAQACAAAPRQRKAGL